MTTEAFGPNIFARNGIQGIKDRKQSGFEIRINVRCQVVSQNEKSKSTPPHTKTTKSCAGEIAIEVMNDQTKVPNEFLLRSVVRFTALIDM